MRSGSSAINALLGKFSQSTDLGVRCTRGEFRCGEITCFNELDRKIRQLFQGKIEQD